MNKETTTLKDVEILISAVIEQMKRDVEMGDVSAIYELLSSHVSLTALEEFLPDEKGD